VIGPDYKGKSNYHVIGPDYKGKSNYHAIMAMTAPQTSLY